MFGYVLVNQGELKVKDYEIYRSFYCGLDHSLKKRYGLWGRLSLNYDLTFLSILYAGLYEPQMEKECCRCLLHPVHKHCELRSSFSDYAADMDVYLTYLQCLDNWQDEHKISSLTYAFFLKGSYKKVVKLYPEKTQKLAGLFQKLSELEKAGEPSVDKTAGCFGEIMAEILAWKNDEWEAALRRMGFFLGKFIYLSDAYEDMEKDARSGNFNALAAKRASKNAETFDEDCDMLMTLTMAECTKQFELLPIVNYLDILRNILYSGVWARYGAAKLKRKEEKKVNEQ